MEFVHLGNYDTLGLHHFIEEPFKKAASCGHRVVSVETAFDVLLLKTECLHCAPHGDCGGRIDLKVSKKGVDEFLAYFQHDFFCKYGRTHDDGRKKISKGEIKREEEGDGGADFRQRSATVMKEAYDEINENYLKVNLAADNELDENDVVADTNFPLIYAAERVEMINTVITFLNERADANIDVGSVQDKSRGPDSEAAGKEQTRDSRYELRSRSGRSSKNGNTALSGKKNQKLPNSNPSEEGPSNRGEKAGGRLRSGFGLFQNR